MGEALKRCSTFLQDLAISKLRAERAGRAAERARARSAPYGDAYQRSKSPFSFNFCAHDRANHTHRKRSTHTLLNNGVSNDPAKSTHAKMAFPSRPFCPCSKQQIQACIGIHTHRVGTVQTQDAVDVSSAPAAQPRLAVLGAIHAAAAQLLTFDHRSKEKDILSRRAHHPCRTRPRIAMPLSIDHIFDRRRAHAQRKIAKAAAQQPQKCQA